MKLIKIIFICITLLTFLTNLVSAVDFVKKFKVLENPPVIPLLIINNFTLSWPQIPGAQSYWIYKSDNPMSPFTKIPVGNVTTWTDPNPSPKAFYYFTADTDPQILPSPKPSSNSNK